MKGENLNKLIADGYTHYIKCELVDGVYIHYVSKPVSPIVNGYIIDYPTENYVFPISGIIKMFESAVNAPFKITNEQQPSSTKDPGIYKPVGNPIVLEFDKMLGTYIGLTGYFTERCKLQCKRNNQFESIYDKFMRVKNDLAVEISKKNLELSITNIFAEFKKYNNIFCSEFNPIWLIGFIKYLRSQGHEINSMLDMSAGRASRLIACTRLGIEYHGTDPNNCVNYESIGNFYSYLSGGEKKCRVDISGFLEAKIEKKNFDLAFTSPPYFDLELYSNAKEDSVTQFGTLDSWLENFMKPSMLKISQHLRSGGIMAINIDNPIHQNVNYVDPMLEYQVPNMKYLGVIYIKNTIPFSVWCWQKD